MKHVDEAPPVARVACASGADIPGFVPPERSPDQDDFNGSLLRGMRGMRERMKRRAPQS